MAKVGLWWSRERGYDHVTLLIDREGRWHAALQQLPHYEGIIAVASGDARGLLPRVSNLATLSEVGGQEYLTLFEPSSRLQPRPAVLGSVLLFMAVILTACATPAPVGPSIPTATFSEDERFKDRVREQIKKVWNYPCVQVTEDKCEHKNADLDVEFVLLASGELHSVKIVRSSGIDIYDSYAVNAIRLAAPYPPVPTTMIPPRKDEAEPVPTPGLRAGRPLPGIKIAARFKYVVEGSGIE